MGTVNVNYTPSCNSCSRLSELSSSLTGNSHIDRIIHHLKPDEFHGLIDISSTNNSFPCSGVCNIDITTRRNGTNKIRTVNLVDCDGNVYNKTYKHIWNSMSDYKIGRPYSQYFRLTLESDLPAGIYYVESVFGYAQDLFFNGFLAGDIVEVTVYVDNPTANFVIHRGLEDTYTYYGTVTSEVPQSGNVLIDAPLSTKYYGSVKSANYNDNDVNALIKELYGNAVNDKLSASELNYASCTYGDPVVTPEDVLTILRYSKTGVSFDLTETEITSIYDTSTEDGVFADIMKNIITNNTHNPALNTICESLFPTRYLVESSVLSTGYYYVTIDADEPSYACFTLPSTLNIGSCIYLYIRDGYNYVHVYNGNDYSVIDVTISDEAVGTELTPTSNSIYDTALGLSDMLYHWIPASEWQTMVNNENTRNSWYLHVLSSGSVYGNLKRQQPTENNSRVVILNTANPAIIKIDFTLDKAMYIDRYTNFSVNIPTSVSEDNTFLKFCAGMTYTEDKGIVYTDFASWNSPFRTSTYYQTANELANVKLTIPMNVKIPVRLAKGGVLSIMLGIHKVTNVNNILNFTIYGKSNVEYGVCAFSRDANCPTAYDIPFDSSELDANYSSVQSAIMYAINKDANIPIASTTTLGGVKIDGETISILNGVISATGSGETAHIHLNKPTLDKFSEEDGQLLFNGEGINTNTAWSGITEKPFTTLKSTAFSVDANGELDIISDHWVGTTAEWNALDKNLLPDGCKVLITDDTVSTTLDTTVTEGSYRAVTSDAVFRAIQQNSGTHTIYQQLTQPSGDGLWIKTNTPKDIKYIESITSTTPVELYDEATYTLFDTTMCTDGENIYMINPDIYNPYGSSDRLTVVKYNITTGTFTQLGQMNYYVTGRNHACLVNNKCYVFSANESTQEGGLQIYDLSTNECTTVDITLPYDYYLCAISVGAKCYIFGGYSQSLDEYTDTIRIYDTETNTLTTSGATLAHARSNITGDKIGTKIYLVGGSYGSPINVINTIEEYDTETDTITTKTTYNVGSGIVHNAVSAFGTSLLIFGGFNGTSTIADIYYYDTVNGDAIHSFPNTALPSAAEDHNAFCMNDGNFYILGPNSAANAIYKIPGTRSSNSYLVYKKDGEIETQIMQGINIDVLGVYDIFTDVSVESYSVKNGVATRIS